MTGYSQDIHATIALMEISYQITSYCSLQGKQLDKVGDYFSPSVAHITISPTMRAIQKG